MKKCWSEGEAHCVRVIGRGAAVTGSLRPTAVIGTALSPLNPELRDVVFADYSASI
jgi:hypothetical protein